MGDPFSRMGPFAGTGRPISSGVGQPTQKAQAGGEA